MRSISVMLPVQGSHSKMKAIVCGPGEQGRYPGIILGMEIFGITGHIRDIAARLAALGYMVIIPDFYHRTLSGAELPYDQEGRKEDLRLMHQLKRDEVLQDVKTAMDYLDQGPGQGHKTGFLGFSLGGHIGYLAATTLPLTASALFYGAWIVNTDIALSRPQPTVTLTKGIADQGGRILYFVGGEDPLITREQLEVMGDRLTESDVPYELVVYPGVKHGFFCEARPETFSLQASEDAWERLKGFFAGSLLQAE